MYFIIKNEYGKNYQKSIALFLFYDIICSSNTFFNCTNLFFKDFISLNFILSFNPKFKMKKSNIKERREH